MLKNFSITKIHNNFLAERFLNVINTLISRFDITAFPQSNLQMEKLAKEKHVCQYQSPYISLRI